MKNNQDGVPLLACSQSSGEDRHSKSSLESVEDAVLTGRVLSLLRSSVPFAEILTRVLGMAWPTSLNTAQPSLSLYPIALVYILYSTYYYMKISVYLFLSKAYGKRPKRGILSILFKSAYPENRSVPGKFIYSFIH